MADPLQEKVAQRAAYEYFNAVSANEWRRAGVAVLLEDGAIFSASPLTYSFNASSRENEDEALFAKVIARYGEKFPKVCFIVRAVDDEKHPGSPKIVYGGKSL